MAMKLKSVLIIIVVTILVVAGIAAACYFGKQSSKTEVAQTPPPAPTSQLTTTPTTEVLPTEAPEEVLPSGWSTYENSENGFEISYPESYLALDDEDNLYGWPNGIVLLYKGGQAYDIVIEVWDAQTEFNDKYGTDNENLTFYKIGNKYITIMDNTNDPENADVIATFKITNN